MRALGQSMQSVCGVGEEKWYNNVDLMNFCKQYLQYSLVLYY